MATRATATRPTITGTVAGQQSTNESPVTPFSQTTITDANLGATDTLTIVLGGAGGTLSGTGLTSTGNKTYALSGTAAQVTVELQGLTFTPAIGKPGSQTTTTFRLTDRSGAATTMPAVNDATSVVDSDTPAAPAAPRLTTTTDTGVSHTDGLTDDATPTVTGNARLGAVVTVYAGNTVIGQGTASASTGAYSIAVSGLSQGSNAISATQTVHGLTSAQGATRTVTLDTTAPTISAVAETVPGIGASGSGTIGTGKKVTFTLTTSEPTYVTGGKPTLTLNDGGVATYEGGSGKNQLKFSYTVAAGQNTNSLEVTGLSTNGATVTDKAGNALNGASLNSAAMPTGNIAVHTTAPTISAVAETVPGIGASGSGTIGTGKKVTFTLTTSEPTYVTGGKPTLTLNDGGVATYEGGSGKNQLKFSYTVAAGQNTNSLEVTGLSTNGATVTDKAGNALNGASLNSAAMPTGNIAVHTTAPTISAVAETVPGIGASGSGTIGTGKKVTFTLTTSEPTYVTGGKPTLTLNDGGVATYEGGSGKNQLKFSYTVAAGQNTNSLEVTGLSTNGATVTDKAGNALNGASLNSAAMPTGTLAVHTVASSSGKIVTVDTAGETVNLQPFSIVQNQGKADTSFVFSRGDGLDVDRRLQGGRRGP